MDGWVASLHGDLSKAFDNRTANLRKGLAAPRRPAMGLQEIRGGWSGAGTCFGIVDSGPSWSRGWLPFAASKESSNGVLLNKLEIRLVPPILWFGLRRAWISK